MQNLLLSRTVPPVSPTKLSNLSPQKYGKAAFAQLCYTQSKLADNVLYRQVTTLKKMQNGTNKARQYEALNSFMRQKLIQLQQERDGIEQTLTQQITMYKKMVHEMQINHENRIKDIQKAFREEIRILIEEKQQEAKFAQSQKQLLEQRIEELEQICNKLNLRISNQGNAYQNLNNDNEKLKIQFKHIENKLQETKQQLQKTIQKNKEQYKELQKKYQESQLKWNQIQNQKQIENKKYIENMLRNYQNEIEKQDNQRSTDNLMRNQQIKDIRNTFEIQMRRLNQIVSMKERIINNLNQENDKEKRTILQLTKAYQQQISDLTYEKTNIINELQQLLNQHKRLQTKYEQQNLKQLQDKQLLQGIIIQLKKQIELNQVNYIRQKDKKQYLSIDLIEQLNNLQNKNISLNKLNYQKQSLIEEIYKLKDLLLESSQEMEQCKYKFIVMEKQKQQLLGEINQLTNQNQKLYRIKKNYDQQSIINRHNRHNKVYY